MFVPFVPWQPEQLIAGPGIITRPQRSAPNPSPLCVSWKECCPSPSPYGAVWQPLHCTSALGSRVQEA